MLPKLYPHSMLWSYNPLLDSPQNCLNLTVSRLIQAFGWVVSADTRRREEQIMRQWRIRISALASGGVCLGLLQSFGGVNFAEILFQFLTQWVSVLATLLFGGELTNTDLLI